MVEGFWVHLEQLSVEHPDQRYLTLIAEHWEQKVSSGDGTKHCR